jgi:hypothetical protein
MCHHAQETGITGVRHHAHLFVEMGSGEIFAQAGLEPWSSLSLCPKKLEFCQGVDTFIFFKKKQNSETVLYLIY